jgi:hypothetical protein
LGCVPTGSVLARAVVVLGDAIDLEPQCLVKGNRVLVRRRRHAADDRPALGASLVEEMLVQRAPHALPALFRRDADEVDVGLVRVRLREEAAEESSELLPLVLGDEARAVEVDEEQLRKHRCHLPAAPPDVDATDDAPVVRWPRMANGDIHGREP